MNPFIPNKKQDQELRFLNPIARESSNIVELQQNTFNNTFASNHRELSLHSTANQIKDLPIDIKILQKVDDNQQNEGNMIIDNPKTFQKIKSLLNPFLNSNIANYGLDKQSQQQIETLYNVLELIHKIKVKFLFQQLSFIKWPIIKDPENYQYSKRSINNRTIYYYCTLYLTKNCQSIEFNTSNSTISNNRDLNLLIKNELRLKTLWEPIFIPFKRK